MRSTGWPDSIDIGPGMITQPHHLHDYQYADGLPHEDRKLVDLTNAVLVDPNLHTDTRLRLAEEVRGLLRDAYEDVHHEPLPVVHRIPHSPTPHDVTDLMSEVLVDPSVHADLRLRLHREIGESLGRMSSLEE